MYFYYLRHNWNGNLLSQGYQLSELWQGQDMSIPGDAPQNLLRPEAAEAFGRKP